LLAFVDLKAKSNYETALELLAVAVSFVENLPYFS